jgi:hypothetical protein
MARIQLNQLTCDPAEAIASSDEANLQRALDSLTAAEREADRQANQRREMAAPKASGEVSLKIKETVHTKRQCPIWIAQLQNRIERKDFSKLMQLARAAGGYWSSYGPEDIHGFIFFEEARANAFVTISSPRQPMITSGTNGEPDVMIKQ